MSCYCWANIRNGHSCRILMVSSHWQLASFSPLIAIKLGWATILFPLPISSQQSLCSQPLSHWCSEPIIWFEYWSIAAPSLIICHKRKGQKIRWKIKNWAACQHCPLCRLSLILNTPSSSPGVSPFPILDIILEVKNSPRFYPLGALAMQDGCQFHRTQPLSTWDLWGFSANKTLRGLLGNPGFNRGMSIGLPAPSCFSIIEILGKSSRI